MSADTVIPQAGVVVDKAILEGLKRYAHTALERGFHPLPCRRKEKTPCITRSANGDRLPTHGEIDGWDCDAVALVCNHVIVFDFDQAGAFWPKWSAKVQAERSDLWARLPIERSQNGGVHVVTRTKRPFLSQKLAHLVVEVSGPGEHPGRGPSDKKYRAREYRGKWVIAPDAIETRGHTTGLPSYCLTHPTPGYELIQGEILDMPVLADADVEYLISVSREFEEYFPESPTKKDPPAHTGSGSPGDDYNERGDVRALLEAHDWQACGSRDEYEHFTRPGKTSGISGALIEGHLFHCFSSNGFPFEDGKTYSKFAVFALLEHDGDYSAAAKALAVQGYGVPVLERIGAAGQGEDASAAGEERFTVLDRDGLMALPDTEYIIKPLFPSRGVVVIHGPSGTGKSFLALDQATHLAEERPWFGHRTKKAPIAYLVLEGMGGFKKRGEAWERHTGRRLPPGLKILPPPREGFDLRIERDVDALIAAVMRSVGKGAVLYIDTLAQAMPGSEENSKDYGAALAMAGKIERAIEGLVVLIAHPGKDAAKGIRGSYALFCGLDANIELIPDASQPDLVTWCARKVKDGENGITHCFRREVVDLGMDADGDLRTSCVIVPDPEADQEGKERAKAMTKLEADSLTTFKQAAMERGELDADGRFSSLPLEDWRAHFYQASTATTPGSKRSAVNKAKTALIKGGWMLEDIYGNLSLIGPGAEVHAEVITGTIIEKKHAYPSVPDRTQGVPGTLAEAKKRTVPYLPPLGEGTGTHGPGDDFDQEREIKPCQPETPSPGTLNPTGTDGEGWEDI